MALSGSQITGTGPIGFPGRAYAGFTAKAEVSIWTVQTPDATSWSDQTPDNSIWTDQTPDGTMWADA